MTYNLFVDETCHIQHDKIPVMCIGYTKVPAMAYKELMASFRKLKLDFKAPEEIKWNKFSAKRLPLYKAVVDFFFDNPLQFRVVVVKYKDRLNHEDFNQGSHDNFYYKMTYFLLRPNPVGSEYRVFMDIKDHHGRQKLRKIEEVFQNYHEGNSPFVHFQHIRSDDNLFFEITDLFIGAVAYKSRVGVKELKATETRMEFIHYLEKKSGYLLDEGTPVWENKFNIFDQQPKMKTNGSK
jgi:hypothetical protein